MKKLLPFFISIMPLAIIAIVCFSFMKNKEEKIQPATAGGFAVVELFTSEGCSSCPAADEALETISKEYKEKNLYLLGFHVDYWNRLGWKDEFSSAAYSNRQRQYAPVFERDGVYTPQAIVNGSTQFVGSDENKLRSEIKNQLSAAVNAMPVINSVKLTSNKVEVTCTVKETNNIIVNVALVQLHAVTDVKAGENEGRQLSHVNIVRDFKMVSAKNTVHTISLMLPAGLTPKDCKVIVYTQDNSRLKITGAASASIQ